MSKNSEFESFYTEFKENAEDPRVTFFRLNQSQQFERDMAKGRSPRIIDWEKVTYGVLGLALFAKGIYFWTK